MLLYRPVGQKELELIFESGMLEFPVRLPEQPLFYPVINRVYAQQIARDWNTKEDTKVGYVTKFEINNEYIKSFEEKIVGSTEHKELWVPAEQVSEFNKQIIGSIEVVDVFFGEDYAGVMPSVGFSNVKNANEFLIQLKNEQGGMILGLYQTVPMVWKNVWPFCGLKELKLADLHLRSLSPLPQQILQKF